MIKKIFLFLILFFGFYNTDLFAAIVPKGGTICSETWTSGNTYNLINSITLTSGCTLTIQSGTVVKFNSGNAMTINGNLQLGNNVVFTSKNDNTVGDIIPCYNLSQSIYNTCNAPDVIVPASTGSPAKGSWGYLMITGVGSNSSLIDGLELRYGGSSSTFGSLYINSNATVTNSQITNGLYAGVTLAGGAPTFTNNTINNHNTDGLIIRANAIVNDNVISSNGGYGINNESGNSTFTNNQILNNTKTGYSSNLELFLSSSNTTLSGNTQKVLEINSFNTLGTTGTMKNYPGYTYYLLSGGTVSSGKTLTIEPGVIVKVQAGTAITSNGNLQAIGTTTDKIIFTSKNDNSVGVTIPGSTGTPSRGSWSDVSLSTTSSSTVLDNVIINYAGLSSNGALLISSNATVRNSLITNGLNEGVYFNSGTPTFSGNTVSNHNGDCIRITTTLALNNNIAEGCSLYGINNESGNSTFSNNQILNNTKTGYSSNLELFLSSANTTLSGNTQKVLEINSFNTLGTTGTMKNYPGYTYYLLSGGTISSGKTLTIEPGVIVKVQAGTAITSNGNLQAIGTTTDKIIFTSKNDNSVGVTIPGSTGTPSRGSWSTVSLSTTSSSTVLDNVIINYAGLSSNGALLISSNATVRNSLITNGLNEGVYFNSGTPTFSGNTVSNHNGDCIRITTTLALNNNIAEGCSLYGINNESGNSTFTNNQILNNTKTGYSSNLELFLSSANTTLSGNTQKVLEINSFNTLGTTGTMKNYPGYSYYLLSGGTVSSGKTLTIQPGVIVKVQDNTAININGNLQAIGTTTDKIIFTSKNDNSVGNNVTGSTGTPSRGNWGYIMVSGAGSYSTIMKYIEIKYAGNSATFGGIYINSNSSLTNSIVSESAYKGITVGGLSPIIKNNIVYKNTGFGIYKSSGTPTISYNLYYLNDGGTLSNHTLDADSITGQNPLFNNDVEYKLSINSPAINKGDPSFGNHPYSGDRYDIGVNEYSGNLFLPYGVNITGTQNRSLTYEWQFTSLPAGATTPAMTVSTGSINSDGDIYTQFTLSKIGNYTVKFIIRDGSVIVGEGTNNFSVSNN